MAFNLGSRIVELRAGRNLSQEALANELGLSRQAVSRWERGEALPDTENLIALADLFGVTLDELVRCPSAEPGHREEPEPGKQEEQDQHEEPKPESPAQPASDAPDQTSSPKPSRHRRIALSLALIALALILIVNAARMLGPKPGSGRVSPDDLPPIVREVEVDGEVVTSIDIVWPSGQVDIIAVEDGETRTNVLIKESRFDHDSEDALLWELDGGALRIFADQSVDYIGETSITIMIPMGMFAPGKNLAQLESISAEVLSGSLNIDGLGLALDRLSATMRSGHMEIGNVGARAFYLEQGTGEAHASCAFDTASIRLSGAGAAEVVAQNRDAASISAEVTSGELNVLLDPEMGFTLTQQIDGDGAVESALPVVHSNDEQHGVCGDGSCAISLQIGDGTARIAAI